MALTTKAHIVYGIIIVFIASIAYHFFKKEPEKIIQTVDRVVTQVKTVEKVVTKDRIVYVDKKIVTHKKNGDIIVETDKEHSSTDTKANIVSNTDTKTKEKDTTITSYQKNYSIEVLEKMNPTNLLYTPNPLDSQINFGVRLFSSPVSLVIGTTGRINSLYLGLRYEW